MTNGELWDFIMEIYKSKHIKDTPLVISSIDDHFNCYFIDGKDQVHFRITVNNSFFGDPSYTINNIFRIGEFSDQLTEKKLKELLVPIVREVKLNLIGI
jgi:hypothetical protein